MKIVCDNCATKYSIADEKVRGKVFKIRCKKCSHIIVVRGGEGAAAQEAQGGAADGGFPDDSVATVAARGQGAPAALGTGEAVWHLVVDREQIGPLTREEVQAKFRAGEVDLETYAWREGFADWLRLGSIDDFRDLADNGAAAAPSGHEGATRRTDTADLFATAAAPQDEAPAPQGGDLFAAHSASAAPTGETPMPASEVFGQAGGALFGAPQASAAPAAAAAPAPAPRPSRTSSPGFSGGGAMAAAASEPAADSGGNQKMTGQRNENSVLFSLNNLQALASGGGAPAAKPSSPAEPRPGFASSQTEGSGLIDIRAMAASTLAASPTGGPSKSTSEPEFASAPLFSPMAAPILMPAPASGPPKWIWALIGVGVLAVAGVAILIVLIATRKADVPPAVAAVTPQAAPVVAGAPPVAAPAQPANPANPPSANQAPAPPPANVAKPEGEEKHHGKHDKGTSPREAKGGHEPPAAAAQPVSAPPPAAEQPKKKKGGDDELDDLLNGATKGSKEVAPKRSAPREDTSADSNLPDQLDKSAIVGGMSKIKNRVADCYVQFKVPGLANVAVTIGKSGHVSAASVSGSFSGTPTGSCVEKAVKSATFPPFKGSPQSINYPFMLR